MPHPEHLEILQRGVKAWNWWRDTSDIAPDLCQVDFRVSTLERFKRALFGTGNSFINMDLSRVNFSAVNLTDTNLKNTVLYRADLSKVNLTSANLNNAFLRRANLTQACLVGSNLFMANLSHATLTEANLYMADLRRACLKNISGWQEIKDIRECQLAGALDAPDGFLKWAAKNGAHIS